jgi:hypothetical protein
MPASNLTIPLANGHAAARTSTARARALRLLDRVQDLVGFLDAAELPAELDLDVAANLAAADGLLARAVQAIEAVGPG